MPRPDLTKVPEHFHKYIAHVKGDDLMNALQKQTKSFTKLLSNIPKSKRERFY